MTFLYDLDITCDICNMICIANLSADHNEETVSVIETEEDLVAVMATVTQTARVAGEDPQWVVEEEGACCGILTVISCLSAIYHTTSRRRS